MKTKFVVVWFNQFFGQNKYSVKECDTMSQVYDFIDWVEKIYKQSRYELKFVVKTVRGDRDAFETEMQNL